MKYLTLQFSVIATVCILMAGCGSQPRAFIAFNYTPTTKVPFGSTDVTFAFISTQSEMSNPMFKDLSDNLVNDFEAILIARGFGVTGTFRSYEQMTDTDKAGSDLILVANVEFSTDITQLKWRSTGGKIDDNGNVVLPRWDVTGPVTVNGNVNLWVIDSLTTEILGMQRMSFTPIRTELRPRFFGRYYYKTGFVQNLMRNEQAHLDVLADFLEKDNEFHATVGSALSTQYPEVMNKVYGYLDPKVMAKLIPSPEPDRVPITFDYTPPEETTPGSAGAIFAVVGARFDTPVPLYSNFARSMANDFGEILTARGYGLRGPFRTYEDILYPDKLGSNLILTTEVIFDTDRTQIHWAPINILFNTDGKQYYRASGSITIGGRVNLVVSESLTNETMWQRSIAITPAKVKIASRAKYPSQANLNGQLKHDNKFHADVGGALSTQYAEIMKTIYDYLHPGEMQLIMKAAADARKRATISDK